MKISPRLRLITLLAAAAMILAVAAGFSRQAKPVEKLNTPIEKTEKAPKYIVREHLGMVAVFDGANDTEPIKTSDTPVWTLPKADRDELVEGIAVNSDDELARLLEDFYS